jgi:glycosyltransferase involved in cell wall biosynthesis
MRNNITAVVITKNEAGRLQLVFDNLHGFTDEILVFDGGSTDGTRAICDANGVPFIRRPPELRNLVGEELKFAYSHVKTEYVLLVNCSHHYPQKLLSEFKRVAKEGRYYAVYHDFLIYTYGTVVHRPFFRRRSSASTFYRLDAINFADSSVHNEVPIQLPNELKWSAPALDEYSVHLFRDYVVKKAETNYSFYSDQDSAHRIKMGGSANLATILFKPLKIFMHQYFRCGSILYGYEGLIYSLLHAQLELNVQLKMWELQNGFDIDSISATNAKMRRKLIEAKT